MYELDPVELGWFDLVFCGDLLVHLKDPISAVQRLHGVCRGSAIVCNPVKRFPLGRGRGLAVELERLVEELGRGRRQPQRHTRPSTRQLLEDPQLAA